MKNTTLNSLLIGALLLTAFSVLGEEDELKVKINNPYTYGTRACSIQFNYDSREILQITKVEENFGSGIFSNR